MAVRGAQHRMGTKVSTLAHVLALYLLLHQALSAYAEDCPCRHCGPPMCAPMCALNCVKCCTCCVYFEARIGKRVSEGRLHPYGKWETEGRLDINKREPNKEISLRLSILQKSEGQMGFLPQHQQELQQQQQLSYLQHQRHHHQQQHSGKRQTNQMHHQVAIETLPGMEIQDGGRLGGIAGKSGMDRAADGDTFSAAAGTALSGRTAELPEMLFERMEEGEEMGKDGMVNLK